jgi:hypothetical protein
MKTYMSWDADVGKGEKTANIPKDSFNCPKLNIGDIISFAIEYSKSNVLTPVKITHVSIEIGWKAIGELSNLNKIDHVEQFVYVSPIVYNPESVIKNH